ncbi:MAG TPA: asparagine synthase-related protein, partial [Rubrivivax sp.]|nr:asparagine synthase-related protein [Rubrivivax sp.]
MSTDGFGAGHAAANGPAGGARVWFEGEVHNLPELRAELNLAGDEPAAQVLWAAWQRWGERLGEHLDGVFALALADAERLLLVRDASGLRALYVDTQQPGGPWFGGALDARVPASDAQREIVPAALHEYLRLGDICAPRTIWRNVSAIEPGVPWRLDGHGLHPAADGAPARTPVPAPSFDAAVERLDALLHEAVARRLGDAERPAAFLSGGIDSALICAIAARGTPRPVAVTVGFEGAGFDEAPVAARIASHLGIVHRVLRFGRRDYLGAFDRLARGMDQPMADPAAMATLLAFEHCREHFDVVLDGT